MQHPNFTDTFFHKFTFEVDIDLPKQFTYPFYYQPHELSVLAAEDLQHYLKTQTDFEHNFGLYPDAQGLVIGKMFGVMVVQHQNGDLGYLAAFSGKLAESNYHKGFVPTVYNTLDETGFYKKGEAELNVLNAEIETLENASELKQARLTLDEFQKLYNKELAAFKADIKTKKKTRNLKRESAKTTLSSEAFEVLLEDLKSESIYYHFRLKDLKKDWEAKIEATKHHLDSLLKPIEALKEKRATLSASLQKRLHEQYRISNDIKYEKFINVRARLYETIQTKSAQVVGDVVYLDNDTKQTLDTFTIDSGFIFEHIFARFRGDKRALLPEDRQLLNNRRLPFPSNEQMVFDTGEDLKLRLKNIINSYSVNRL